MKNNLNQIITKKHKSMESNENLLITLRFALAKIDEEELDSLICNELCEDEKIDILMALDDDRIKSVLMNLGFEDEFIDSL